MGLRFWRWFSSWRRSLPVVLATVIFCFVGATAYSEYVAARIDHSALEIANNAAPSIEHLTLAHTELRNLMNLLVRATAVEPGRARPDPYDNDAVSRCRLRMEEEIRAYLNLPVFKNERQLWQDTRRELTRFEDVADRQIAALRAQHLDEAIALLPEVLTANDVAKLAIERVIDFNARQAHDVALRIQRERRQSTTIAILLDFASVIMTALLGWLLWRALREHTGLVESHNRLLAQRAQDMEDFAGRVAHDVLSPLSNVELAIGLANRAEDDETRRARLERASSSVQRVKRIVDGLLDFARAGAPPDDGRSDIGEVIRDLATELQPAAADADIRLNIPQLSQSYFVGAAPGVLTSLIANLVRNAIKYMGDGQRREIEIRVLERADYLRVEVADTGPGLPPDLEAHVFEPYVRAKGVRQPGIGLGLATVKRMTEAHGGTVGVKSTPGQGCRFWFELPKAKADVVSLPEAASQPRAV
jgi:signal transduction histidine kinase